MFTRIYNIRHRSCALPVQLIIIVLLMVAGHFSGCEPEDLDFNVDCGQCYEYEPDSAKLIVYLTIDAANDSVPLTFFKGSFEDGNIDWQDTATEATFYLYSEINQEYTVQATYHSGEKTILAFDADEMYLSDNGETCGYPCYIVKGGIFDLTLAE